MTKKLHSSNINNQSKDEEKKKNFCNRPWGSWEVLDKDEKFKVKKLVIQPGQSISYQMHKKRSETWIIVQGQGILMHQKNLNNNLHHIYEGKVFTIEKEEWHKVINTSEKIPLIAIEVQQGKCEETDIVRI